MRRILHPGTKPIEQKSNVQHIEIVCIIDESGSMAIREREVINGFNSFISEQLKLDAPANLTLITFNTEQNIRYDSVPLLNNISLNSRTYQPEGGTALLDAIGESVNNLLDKYNKANLPHTIILIMTDGEENSSINYTFEQVKALIQSTRRDHDWLYVFIGADEAFLEQADLLGIDRDTAYHYDVNNTAQVFAAMSYSTTSYRQGNSTEVEVLENLDTKK